VEVKRTSEKNKLLLRNYQINAASCCQLNILNFPVCCIQEIMKPDLGSNGGYAGSNFGCINLHEGA